MNAGFEETRKAISALKNHSDPVSEACINHHGQMEDKDENNAAVQALLKHRLAYPSDTAAGIQIHGKVRGLFNHVSSRVLFRAHHSTFAGLVDELDNSIYMYLHTRKRGGDIQASEIDIQEKVIEISELLTEAVSMFHYIVTDEFSLAPTISERVRQTTRCIKQLEHFNTLFRDLEVENLRTKVGHDIFLERQLMKRLKRIVDANVTSMAEIGRRLNHMLNKFIRDERIQKLNGLIDTFYAHYAREPGYSPNIAGIDDLPEVFHLTESLQTTGYADIESVSDEPVLENMAIKALEKCQSLVKVESESNKLPIVDARDEEGAPEILDHLFSCAEEFIEALMLSKNIQRLSAMDQHSKLGIPASPADWMLVLMNYYDAQKGAISRMWDVKVLDLTHPVYPGTSDVIDVVFIRRTGRFA
jgi:hypothetical protein